MPKSKGKKKHSHPKIEDFFTVFLAKKKKKLSKKMDKIKKYENIQAKDLTIDQSSLLERKPEILGELKDIVNVKDMYYTAYAKAPKELKSNMKVEIHEKEPETPAEPQVNIEEVKAQIIKEVSHNLANLLVVGSYFGSASNRESFAQQNQNLLSGFGNGFLESVSDLTSNLAGAATENNEERIESTENQIANYLNKSALIATVATLPFTQIHSGVETIASNDGFLELVAGEEEAEPVEEEAPVEEPEEETPVEQPTETAEPEVEEPAPVQKEETPVETAQPVQEEKITLVKTSGKKPVKRERIESEAKDEFMADDSEDEQAVEEAAPAVETKTKKKKVEAVWQTTKPKQKKRWRGRGGRRGGRGGRGRGGRGGRDGRDGRRRGGRGRGGRGRGRGKREEQEQE